MSVFVIAEVGSSWVFTDDWKKNFKNALRAISIAADAGCSACKFQWCSNPARMAERRKVKREAYWQVSWPPFFHKALAEECRKAGIEYMVTVYLPEDVAVIAPYVSRFKIASLESGDLELLKACAKYPTRQIIISRGASTKAHVDASWRRFPPSVDIKHLQCTAAYPTPLDELNLAVAYHGLSDHSANVLTGAVAVGIGAEIIEVHFRLTRTLSTNPDYQHSHPPASLREYIQNIRTAEQMMGDGVKKIEKSEEALMKHRVTT